ncbi:hypothetical protein EKH55_3827 [Sinorhizobium alkalisoli]|nr:hypothetical protein EKH55_3827 [Sinorhizobium alkalisoli]
MRSDRTIEHSHHARHEIRPRGANCGIPLPEAMQQSLHKLVTQAAST